MVGVGRDLCGSPSPTPCPSRVTYSRLQRTLSRRGWNISREGDSTASLGSLGQCSVTLRGKFFLKEVELSFQEGQISSFADKLCSYPQGSADPSFNQTMHPTGFRYHEAEQMLATPFMCNSQPRLRTHTHAQPPAPSPAERPRFHRHPVKRDRVLLSIYSPPRSISRHMVSECCAQRDSLRENTTRTAQSTMAGRRDRARYPSRGSVTGQQRAQPALGCRLA